MSDDAGYTVVVLGYGGWETHDYSTLSEAIAYAEWVEVHGEDGALPYRIEHRNTIVKERAQILTRMDWTGDDTATA